MEQISISSNSNKAAGLKIAIVGGGPSCLYVLTRILKSNITDWQIHIFEKGMSIGAGMPYSPEGANEEHVTNVSDKEVPELITDIKEWIKRQPKEILQQFGIELENFHQYKVLPRLLFGRYLTDQFNYISDAARKTELTLIPHYKSKVVDVVDMPGERKVEVVIENGTIFKFDKAIICTGHHWIKKEERTVSHFFNSPYPPAKLKLNLNHTVAIRGASLSAIDAMKTIARSNGVFSTSNGKVNYSLDKGSKDFRIILHSLKGLLPAFRIHLSQASPSGGILLTEEEIATNRNSNDGFLSLDYVYDVKYKNPLKESDPEFYDEIKDMSIEAFTDHMLQKRLSIDAFDLFNAEYVEAEKSIKRKQSIYWKESLAELSYILNYPAKYLSAEDMTRLRKVLSPLISVVIAFIPQSSGLELIALHDAGVLSLFEVGAESKVIAQKEGGAIYYYEGEEQPGTYFKTFIDCVGQQAGSIENFPFGSLIKNETATQAKIRFHHTPSDTDQYGKDAQIERGQNGFFYLNVPGVAINDNFQLVDKYGASNDRIFMMAVPYISGFNPDYSGLDFCEQASGRIVSTIIREISQMVR